MYLAFKIISVALIATTLMTAFSYMASSLADKNYREPELINSVFNVFKFFPFNLKLSSAFGWIVHYFIGLSFTSIAFFLSSYFKIVIDSTFGIAFGAASGIIGVVSWKFAFKKVGSQLPYPCNGYYIQLFIAHLLFGLAISLTIPIL